MSLDELSELLCRVLRRRIVPLKEALDVIDLEILGAHGQLALLELLLDPLIFARLLGHLLVAEAREVAFQIEHVRLAALLDDHDTVGLLLVTKLDPADRLFVGTIVA